MISGLRGRLWNLLLYPYTCSMGDRYGERLFEQYGTERYLAGIGRQGCLRYIRWQQALTLPVYTDLHSFCLNKYHRIYFRGRWLPKSHSLTSIIYFQSEPGFVRKGNWIPFIVPIDSFTTSFQSLTSILGRQGKHQARPKDPIIQQYTNGWDSN